MWHKLKVRTVHVQTEGKGRIQANRICFFLVMGKVARACAIDFALLLDFAPVLSRLMAAFVVQSAMIGMEVSTST